MIRKQIKNWFEEFYKLQALLDPHYTIYGNQLKNILICISLYLFTGEPYYMIRQQMKNCIEEIYYKLQAWLDPRYATYGNQLNTFSNEYKPIIYDYVFHKENSNDTRVWASWFELPFFKTILNIINDDDDEEDDTKKHKEDKKEEISFSDHEAVTTTIYMWH